MLLSGADAARGQGLRRGAERAEAGDRLGIFQGLSHSELSRQLREPLAPSSRGCAVASTACATASIAPGDPMNLRNPERADALAGEYVLGNAARRATAAVRAYRAHRTDRGRCGARLGRASFCRWPSRCPRSPRHPASGRRSSPASAAPPRRARARSLLWAPAGWWRGLALVGLATSLALAIALAQARGGGAGGHVVVVLAGATPSRRWSRLPLVRARLFWP